MSFIDTFNRNIATYQGVFNHLDRSTYDIQLGFNSGEGVPLFFHEEVKSTTYPVIKKIWSTLFQSTPPSKTPIKEEPPTETKPVQSETVEEIEKLEEPIANDMTHKFYLSVVRSGAGAAVRHFDALRKGHYLRFGCDVVVDTGKGCFIIFGVKLAKLALPWYVPFFKACKRIKEIRQSQKQQGNTIWACAKVGLIFFGQTAWNTLITYSPIPNPFFRAAARGAGEEAVEQWIKWFEKHCPQPEISIFFP